VGHPRGQKRPLAPLRVYGPSRPAVVPAGDATFHRQTTIHPELPAPGTADLVQNILASYVYHLNVMPLDARMPAAGALVRAIDIGDPARTEGITGAPGRDGLRRALTHSPGRRKPRFAVTGSAEYQPNFFALK